LQVKPQLLVAGSQVAVPLVTMSHVAAVQHWVMAMHLPLQGTKPCLHWNPQPVVGLQIGSALRTPVEQATQAAPHALMSVSATQAPLQAWYPGLHWMPQLVPSQVALPFAGAEQAVQLVPQLCTLWLLTHRPLQSCCPDGQLPEQAWDKGMQAPKQSFWLVGQLPPQLVPSQVALPPVGTVQGVQLPPQLAVEVFDRHSMPQA
jgi:hypothetical protein